MAYISTTTLCVCCVSRACLFSKEIGKQTLREYADLARGDTMLSAGVGYLLEYEVFTVYLGRKNAMLLWIYCLATSETFLCIQYMCCAADRILQKLVDVGVS